MCKRIAIFSIITLFGFATSLPAQASCKGYEKALKDARKAAANLRSASTRIKSAAGHVHHAVRLVRGAESDLGTIARNVKTLKQRSAVIAATSKKISTNAAETRMNAEAAKKSYEDCAKLNCR